VSRREGGWSVQECALFFSVCDESAHCADAFTVYTPCVWVRTSGVCVITNSMCVCRGVEWGVVIRWVWSSATALRYVSCVGDDVAPARCAIRRVCGVWGVQPTMIYFSGHRGAWIIIVNGP